jgi:hypothetical protein
VRFESARTSSPAKNVMDADVPVGTQYNVPIYAVTLNSIPNRKTRT